MQQAQQTYNGLQAADTKMPRCFLTSQKAVQITHGEFLDGSDADDSDGEDSSYSGYDNSGSDGGTVTADTSALKCT